MLVNPSAGEADRRVPEFQVSEGFCLKTKQKTGEEQCPWLSSGSVHTCALHTHVHTCDIPTHKEKDLKFHELSEKILHMANASRTEMLACHDHQHGGPFNSPFCWQPDLGHF